jgi:Spy/CpxP family protein refolding chaperone
MKKLTKTLLTATLILGLPLGAYAASEAVTTAQPGMMTDCPMDGSGMMGGKHHGGRHDKMARMKNMTPEQIQAHLQQRYDKIEDPAKKAEFVKNLGLRADGMIKHAEVMKQFAEANQ